MSCINKDWPEPVIRVQSISDSNSPFIPPRYVKSPSQRPTPTDNDSNSQIPLVDMENGDWVTGIGDACREWGFFQVVNHGVGVELMDTAREVWREFFYLPMNAKQKYANSPRTYEGYGSRLGVEKGVILDWSDYYFLHFLPPALKDHSKWPSLPSSCRKVMDEYGKEVLKFCGVVMNALSKNLGLGEGHLCTVFGGSDKMGACLRVNFYPKCPQPNLALGLSSHSDPGGLTILLPDPDVLGLQVRKDEKWITVKPVRNAFIVNIGDQIQVLSNAIYKSVEHRVTVNSEKERVSLALFYNPRSDILIQPIKDLVPLGTDPLYRPMTFDEYRLFIRLRGPGGKAHVESLKSQSLSN